MKALVGAFNKEKVLVGLSPGTVKLRKRSFTTLINIWGLEDAEMRSILTSPPTAESVSAHNPPASKVGELYKSFRLIEIEA